MLGPAWVTLFRKLPPALHDNLVMITATGAEVMIQKILILEADYMVFRGRMSGVQDMGLVLMMPYDQISNVAIAKRILEPELRQIFSGMEFIVSASDAPAHDDKKTAEAARDNADEASEEDAAEKEEATVAAKQDEATEPDAAKPTQPTKNTLLARLRARLAGKN